MSKKPTPPARKPLAAAKGPAKGPSVSTLDTSAVNMVQVRALDNRLKQIEDFQKSLKEFLSRNPIFESVTLAEKGASKGGIKLIASKDGVFLTALQGTPCAVIVASQKGSHTIRIDGDKARIEVRDADGKPSILVDGAAGDVTLPDGD